MGNNFLPKNLKKKIFTPEKKDYGYAWYIEDTPINMNGTETLQVYHQGRVPGFSASLMSLVEDDHTIIILGNNDIIPIEEISEKIKLTLYDMPYDLPRKSIIPIMLQSIEKQGIEIAISEYKKMKSAQENIWTFRVNELNDLANELIKLDKEEEAKLIFELNLKEFPDEYLPYFSLGGYYQTQNNQQKAIEFYKLALEKNYNNETIKSRLKGLGEEID